MGRELKLEPFKQLYQRLKKEGVVVWNHLLLGLLVYIESIFVRLRSEEAVDSALEQLELPSEDYVTPIITEKPSEASTSLSELRITAPWYKEP